MLTHIAAAGLAFVLGASDYPSPAGKSGGVARIAAVEKELCLSVCPPMSTEASSDWLRSAEGQKANACHTMCRLEQPATAMFRSASELASANPFNPELPLVKLAGKEGPELARRLRVALKDSEGKKLTPVCTRARASLAPPDETMYLECVGRVVRPEAVQTVPLPDSVRGLRCATLFAEKDADWLRRCPAVETAAVDACLDRVEVGARSRRQYAADVRSRCESESVERIASTFRHRGRP